MLGCKVATVHNAYAREQIRIGSGPRATVRIGDRYGALIVLQQAGSDQYQNRLWLCRCDCGQRHTASTPDLRSGDTGSCGCYGGRRTHGQSTTLGYGSWRQMKSRCTNPKATGWEYYGGAGVRCCERWATFENFLADMGERPKGTSLGRFNDTGNYEPGNCSWQTPAEQAANRRARSH